MNIDAQIRYWASLVNESMSEQHQKMQEIDFSQAKKDLADAKSDDQSLDRTIIKKALDYPSSNSKVYELKTDDGSVGAMAVVREDEGPGTYLHELVGFRKGYGKEILKQICDNYRRVWLQCNLLGNGEDKPYKPNEGLRDKFYRRCDFLKEYIVKNPKSWNCEASFFYTPNISDGEISRYLEKHYGKQ